MRRLFSARFPDFRKKMPALPVLTALEASRAHDDPKPDSAAVTAEMKVSTHFWESCDLKATRSSIFLTLDAELQSVNGGTDEALPTIELRFQHREYNQGSHRDAFTSSRGDRIRLEPLSLASAASICAEVSATLEPDVPNLLRANLPFKSIPDQVGRCRQWSPSLCGFARRVRRSRRPAGRSPHSRRSKSAPPCCGWVCH